MWDSGNNALGANREEVRGISLLLIAEGMGTNVFRANGGEALGLGLRLIVD